MPKPPPPESRFWIAWEAFAGVNTRLFKATNGRIGGRIPFTKVRILILHHVGRKSGKPRESPLNYVEHGDTIAVIASKGGIDKHPAWFHNVTAADTVEVDLPGGEHRRVRPRVAQGTERDEWWQRAVDVYSPYADYQSYTDRQIPVVLLEPAG
jgi:F420H(2)-dependent quinone reductase